ncbi:hypothetical protein [Gimesia chilikensis]|uniref:hypothetical protein n=1 Tax=Gimesia chilikensis TaxID=2605989 RepID=UPI003A92BF54
MYASSIPCQRQAWIKEKTQDAGNIISTHVTSETPSMLDPESLIQRLIASKAAEPHQIQGCSESDLQKFLSDPLRPGYSTPTFIENQPLGVSPG